MRLALFVVLSLTLSMAQAQRPAEDQLEKWYDQAMGAMQQQDFQSAAGIYDKIILATKLEQPGDYKAVYQRAVCSYYLGNLEESLQLLERFEGEMEAVPSPHLLRTYLYRELGQMEEVIKSVDRGLPYVPAEKQADFLQARATAFAELSRFAEARSDVRRILKMEETASAQGLNAFILYEAGEYDSALMAVNRAIELDYKTPNVYRYGASFCLQQQDNELALTYVALGLRVEPDDQVILFMKGAILVEKGQLDSGCSCLNKAFYSGYEDAGDYLQEYCYPSDH